MTRALAWLFTASILSGAAAACTTPQATPGSDAGAGGDAARPPGTSCLQILQCIVACPDTDAACPDACGEKGTPEGKEHVTALAVCIDREKCTEGTCTKTKCAAPLDACLASSAPKNDGTALTGTAPPGSVPGDLVGSWAGARNGITERLIFNADGTGSWMSAIASQQSACFSFVRTTRSGTVVITEKTITVHATSVLQQEQRCAPPTTDTKQPARTFEIQWSRASEADTILIVDAECAAKYPNQEGCNTAGCPIGLYCTSRLKRE